MKQSALDSITEIAEMLLSDLKGQYTDGRKAYGETGDRITTLIRKFRDIPMNVYFSAQEGLISSESGIQKYQPILPGQKLTTALGYHFDEVFRLIVKEPAPNVFTRELLTSPDVLSLAKDRSGKLDQFEPANLGLIFKKITGE